MTQWSTLHNGDAPGKLQSFASELSQTSISLAALSALFRSQAAGQVEGRALCFLKEQALVCMYRNLVVKLWTLLSSVFTGPVQEPKAYGPVTVNIPHSLLILASNLACNLKVRDDPGHQAIFAPMQTLDRKKT